mmetsp:Transcript_19795/g.22453  ORF Transcript_19795/g.22453 Transcript_19795/m.22453 type:complete len:336 (-) Transcript_19795:176-1183(-)
MKKFASRILKKPLQANFSTLVIADHNNAKLSGSTFNVVTGAKQFGEEVHVLVAGKGCADVAKAAAKIEGVDKVLLAENDAFEHGAADTIAKLVAEHHNANNYNQILASSSSLGKDVIPRIGGLLEIQPISDVMEVQAKDTFKRPIYAGNAIATVKSSEKTNVMTLRTTNFDQAVEGGEESAVESINYDSANSNDRYAKWVGEELSQSDKPELTSAPIVVSGGRGLKGPENFELLDKLADALGGAAVGASRAAVDAGWVPNDLQVGQTGKVVAPGLYFAVGISGAIQHLAGMKDSKVIVAINKDAEAPIFQVADYGIVGDLFKVVPELTEKLAASK